MELARAFTTRNKKQEMHITSPMYIGRAASQRGGRPVQRNAISSPLALVSTSNVQLNNAQAIAGTSPIDIRTASSGSSVMSSVADDSDTSSNHRSAGTVTDASSIEESPVDASPGENHLSCYFKPAVDTQVKSPVQSPISATFSNIDTPKVPQRVPSHSKRAHETVHRKNSVRKMLSPPATAREATRNSTDFFGPSTSSFVEAPKENPFGNELAQLDEVAEEFGQVVLDAESAADMAVINKRGLARYAASDYMNEIQDLIYLTFAVKQLEVPAWI